MTFQDREKGEEARFAHDADLRFKASARRNKLLGYWAAELMGLTELAGRQEQERRRALSPSLIAARRSAPERRRS